MRRDPRLRTWQVLEWFSIVGLVLSLVVGGGLAVVVAVMHYGPLPAAVGFAWCWVIGQPLLMGTPLRGFLAGAAATALGVFMLPWPQ